MTLGRRRAMAVVKVRNGTVEKGTGQREVGARHRTEPARDKKTGRKTNGERMGPLGSKGDSGQGRGVETDPSHANITTFLSAHVPIFRCSCRAPPRRPFVFVAIAVFPITDVSNGLKHWTARARGCPCSRLHRTGVAAEGFGSFGRRSGRSHCNLGVRRRG